MFILRAETEWPRESLTGSDGRRKEKGQDPVHRLALDMKMDSSSEVTRGKAENLLQIQGRLVVGG